MHNYITKWYDNYDDLRDHLKRIYDPHFVEGKNKFRVKDKKSGIWFSYHIEIRFNRGRKIYRGTTGASGCVVC